MHPTQHSYHRRRPRNAEDLLAEAVTGLQRLAFEQAHKATHALNIEPPHAPLLRAAAEQSSTFRVIAKPLSTSAEEGA